MRPILPGLTDRERDLEALVAAAAAARARYLCANVVFLMPSAQKKFFPFLEEKFPRLLKQYRKWYARRAYAPEAYRKEISARMHRLRAKYGYDQPLLQQYTTYMSNLVRGDLGVSTRHQDFRVGEVIWPKIKVSSKLGAIALFLTFFLGIPIGELWDLEALASDCAGDGVYEFMLTSAPLNIPGGVGSPPNALAIK